MNAYQSAADQYCSLMEEVKLRTNVLDAFIRGTATAVYKATNIESIYLQLRKIIELIAFGSLVANREAFSRSYTEFAKFWNARRLLKDIERVNPGFYPEPITERLNPEPGVKAEWQPKTSGFLTRDDFVLLYNRCGAILHSENPYGEKISYDAYETEASVWRDKIVGLLNTHLIRLVDDKNVYLVHMHEEHDGHVHYYTFGPVPDPRKTRSSKP
jgi:hypothetical protein